MVKIIINLQDGGKRIVHKFDLHVNTVKQLETMLNGWSVIEQNIKTLYTLGYQIWSTNNLHSVKIIGEPDIYEIIDITVPYSG
jgi:hypothetical protein